MTILNSWIASIEGRETWVVSSCTFSEIVLLSTPSSRKLFWSERWPWTLTPPVRPKAVPPPSSRVAVALDAGHQEQQVVPVADGERQVGDGVLVEMTVPSAACSVLSSCAWPRTSTASLVPPTPSLKSTRARWPISRMTALAGLLEARASTATV